MWRSAYGLLDWLDTHNPLRKLDLQLFQDVTLMVSQFSMLEDAILLIRKLNQMDLLHLMTDGSPGLMRFNLRHPDQYQTEPAQKNMGCNPIIPAVIDGTKTQTALQGPEGPLHL